MKKNISSTYSLLFILVFFGILIVPLGTLQLNPHQIDEDFYGRGRLIRIAANFRIWIGDQVFFKAIVGKDGWLFYTGEGNIDNYQNVNPFSEEELARIQHNLDNVTGEYTQRGITLLVVIPPSKPSIYSEYMPEDLSLFGSESRLDQLIKYMKVNGKTNILDLRSVLKEAKEDRQIYYATDTHWNEYGAFLAYQGIASQLSATHPKIRPYSLSDYKIQETELEVLDIARVIGTTTLREPKIIFKSRHELAADFSEINIGGSKIMYSSIAEGNLPKAIIYYDSFFRPVIPFLGEHFSQALYIQNYLGGGIWSLRWVEEIEPDIVIVEFSERYIHDLDRLVSLNK